MIGRYTGTNIVGFIGNASATSSVALRVFSRLPKTGRGVYFDAKHRLLLIVYVDDMKLSGPAKQHAAAWQRLGANITLEPPKGDTNPDEHTFLGCIHRRKEVWVAHPERPQHKVRLTIMEYDMTASMERAVAKYQAAVYELTGEWPRVNGARTPFLAEETVKAPQRAPHQ